MRTEIIISRLFCIVDDKLSDVNHKRPDATLFPSEIITIGLLFALKGGHFRAFYHWLEGDFRYLFPLLPEPGTPCVRLLRLQNLFHKVPQTISVGIYLQRSGWRV